MTLPLYIGMTLFVLFLYITANIYIPKRLCSLFGIQKARLPIIIFSFISILGTWGIVSSAAKTEAGVFLSLLKLSITWIGLAFYLLLFLICYEIIHRFIPLNRKKSGLAIIGLSFAVLLYGIWNARDYRVTNVEIPIDNLSGDVRVFHVPDIHLGPFRGKEMLVKITADIARLKPDFVLINGDLVDGLAGLEEETLKLFQTVTCPIYFTGGNHDNYVDIRKLKVLLPQYGVRVLDNEVIHTKGIQLVGLDYMNADDEVYDAHASERTETIKSVMPNLRLDQEIPIIVAHHNAVGIKYMAKAGADLVLSGHTHAGQFFPATLVAKLQFPYLKGLYQFEKTQVYVSQGIGTFGPPVRIGTKGEATLVKLVPAAH